MTEALHKVSPLRVSVRPDFDALDVTLPEGAPTRTEDGKAWVRWVRYGSYSGYYAAGSRKPRFAGRPTFWEAVYSVACECAGGTVDQAHCCGRGVLALGGLGVTMRSGYAQLLLHCCLLANPARYVEVMAPAIQLNGAYTKVTETSPSGVALCQRGKYAMSEDQLRSLILGGSDSVKWTSRQKDRARVWVSCCSQLLRDEAMDKAQLSFIEEVTPALITEATKVAIKWPRNGPRDWWQYTHSQQMLWALALVLALDDEQQTERLMVGAVAALTAQPDAPLGSEDVLRRVNLEIQEPEYENMFRMRCLTAGRLLSAHMQVTL
jgi:hypothetical protein